MTAMKTSFVCITFVVLAFAASRQSALAQDDTKQQLDKLTQRVDQLDSSNQQLLVIAHRETGGAALWLFGAFCALWAQNTNRSAWVWFFMGLLFSVITVLVLLYKNSQDRLRRRVQFTG
jgi:hypothetical protein